MKSLGICIGASTISSVGVERRSGDDSAGSFRILEAITRPHDGNPREALVAILKDIDLDQYNSAAVTGRKFRGLTSLTSISEPEAVETALFHIYPRELPLTAVLSAGGENFLVYVLGKDRRITSVQTGNKCASGTGEFFLQQLGRLKVPLADAMRHAANEVPFKVSGRCSVFCKSDCTHATNKGVPRERVVAGLCRMMAGKVFEILRQLPRKDIMVIGGVSRNTVMMECLREGIENLIVPKEAPYCEALGCAIWAAGNETAPVCLDSLFRSEAESFFCLPPLADSLNEVEFKSFPVPQSATSENCILGLDVGSTTTKAALVRTEDKAVLASVYLRTNGDPVGASRQCYAEILGQLGTAAGSLRISGLGVTGSGRQIAGLHAMTDGVINEIIAHASGAVYYDPGVDTIFEIGGQDAKYISLTGGVASDYAMNDACSAGTGSFLEEAARESLGIETARIGDIAMQGTRPPNFNDQCAAFIGSDIKNAFHEGIEKENVLAGLVYSICMNYLNRVKGSRPVGNTIFMQGGVCYNRAVPVAMASLTGKKIIVPPDPGLVGAFGVALELEKRISLGLVQEGRYSLEELARRELQYKEPFRCNGGKEGCDRKCEIARIAVEGRIYPFGGSCNKWYNVRFKRAVNPEKLNFVARHEHAAFDRKQDKDPKRQTIGINKSFFTNSYFPLYGKFFSELGYNVELPSEARQEGMDRKGAAFCYPAEIAHGFFQDLLDRNPDYLFLPQVAGVAVSGCQESSSTCPVSQAEPYYIKTAFKDKSCLNDLKVKGRLLSPVLDFSPGLENSRKQFLKMGRELGHSAKKARAAFECAVSAQETFFSERRNSGREFLSAVDEAEFGIVILGRPYNAYVSEAHMGIPQKIASRGIAVAPVDSLPLEDMPAPKEMYWSAGKTMLMGAEFIASHPKLFACYISNFSCGPDSFVAGFARDRMGRKPMLLLELDSHVADAGLETRIEAFIDIIRNYLRIEQEEGRAPKKESVSGKTYYDPGRDVIIDSGGRPHPLHDPRVHVIFPSMGDLLNEAGAAVFRGMGVRATALPPPDDEVLKIGRGNTSCKECLPLLLTTGTLLKYLKEREDPGELLVYFMTNAGGPCRFGQYSVFIKNLIQKLEIRDTTLMSITADDSYSGLKGKNAVLKMWNGVLLSDLMQDVRSFLMASAADTDRALAEFRRQWERVVETIEKNFDGLERVLESVCSALRRVELKRTLAETPVVLLTGEIYVRSDGLSRQYIVEKLARNGIATKTSGVAEWVYYTDWCYEQKLLNGSPDLKKRMALMYRSFLLRKYEKKIKDIWRDSGLLHIRTDNVKHLLGNVGHLISPELRGEAILTVGAALTEVLDPFCGVLSIGPFGCMPNRISEAVLSREMNRGGKLATGTVKGEMLPVLEKYEDLPFLCIESDGNIFPQIITARLEAFVMQARRFHQELAKAGKWKDS